MDQTKKYKLALIGFLTMLVLNIGLIVTIWIIFPPAQLPQFNADRPRVQRFLERELNLDQQQRQQIQALRRKHMAATRPLMTSIRSQRTKFMQSLQSTDKPTNPRQIDSLSTEIGRLHAEMERINYRHFQQISDLLRPEQRQRFYQIIQQTAGRPRPGGAGMQGNGPGRGGGMF